MIKSPVRVRLRGCLPRRIAAVVNIAAPLAIMALMPVAFLRGPSAWEALGAMAVLIAALHMAEPPRVPNRANRPRPARAAVDTVLVLGGLGAMALAMRRPLLAGFVLAALVGIVTLADPLWQRARTMRSLRQVPEAWAQRADKANRSAEFFPQSSDDELPMLQIAGIRIFAYLDRSRDGSLRLTVETDGADADLDIDGGSVLFADHAPQIET